MHRGLLRQLKRTAGIVDEAALAALLEAARRAAARPEADPALAGLLGNLGTFLERIDATYEQADRDLELRTRSLDLSSAELSDANARLREDIATRERAMRALRATVLQLLGDSEPSAAADDIEQLSQLIGRLVGEREKERNRLDNLQFALDEHSIVSVTDLSGTITFANDRFCEISGYPREELLGRNHRVIKSGLHDAAFFEQFWRTITSGEVWRGEVCNRRKDGRLYWVAATVVPLLDENGLPIQYIGIRTDITTRKEAEAELIRARDAAQAANRAKSDFLANMSHEIRTPMNGIIGMTELALDTPLDAEQREYLNIVKSSADSLLTVINDILDFSKIEAGKLQVERIGFDLRRLVTETLKTIALRAHAKGLEVAVDVGADLPSRMIGDPGRLRQVLLNLVGNSIKFTERGEITVRVLVLDCSAGAAQVQVSVSDTGVGIASDKLEHIFEAFAQEDTSTTRRYGGTGLGLTICSRLVDLMGGAMWVDSRQGSGSTFSFILPLGIDRSAVAPAPTFAALAGRRVLVIDDNEVNRQVFSRLLAKWGMTPETAASGAEGQQRLRAAPTPDAILLDVHMPVMDGFAVAAWIRSQPGLDSIPVIVLSSGAVRGDAQRCRDLGLAGYFSKPVADDELQGALSAAFGKSPGQPHAAPLMTRHALREAGQPLQVLLVEDNAVNQQLALRLLEKWGHRTRVAGNGREAIDWLEKESFDAVLMDMQMPVMGGIEATREIRRREIGQSRERVRIIAMTANAMQGDREACLEAGMDDYLSKPIRAGDLAEKLGMVTETVEREAGRDEPVFAFDYGAALLQMDQEIVDIIAPTFLEHCQRDMTLLESGVASGDAEMVMRQAHSFKGVAASFGAAPAQRHAAEIEAAAKSGDLDLARGRLPMFQAELDGLLAELRKRSVMT